MNTELNSLLSDFKNQLNIPEYEQNVLRGFFNFLINRVSTADEDLIPYGMLVQYDEEESLEIFKKIIDKVPDMLKTEKAYHTFITKEDNYYNLPFSIDRQDIIVITDCSEDDGLELMKARFEASPEIIKIICAPDSVVENRFKKDEHFFYRMLPRHLHLGKLRSNEITGQFLSLMKEKGYHLSDTFINEIGYYIESIYDDADFQNREFVLDLVRRIELQMEENDGIAQYKKDSIVDESFIPYSIKVNTRKENENDIQAKIESAPQPKEETKPAAKKEEVPEIPAVPTENEIHVQEHKPSDKICNVLLLALSIFPFNHEIRKTVFKYEPESGPIEVTGRYQLDPIPIMLDELLTRKNNGTLDKIIMLCTKETLEKVEKIKSPEGFHYNISPEDYFKSQVRNYMRPNTSDEDLFTVIEVELNSPYHGIQSVINVLRDIKDNHPNQQLDLYLETHGGIRGIQRIMEATVSLLKNENIKVKEAFAVDFASKLIISETENMKIYDFVSGVNEFFACGRADTLREYKKNLENTQTNSTNTNAKNVFSEEEVQLMNAISDVATGIQWCSIPAFDQGIEDLQKIFPQEENSEIIKKDNVETTEKNIGKSSYLDIYKDNIQKDYSTLLKTTHTVLDEIEWCINKGFYQQALTLIESKISDLLVYKLKLFTFNPPKGLEKVNKGKTIYYSYTFTNKYGTEFTKKLTINNVFNDYIFAFNRLKNYKKPWIDDEAFNNFTEQKYKNFRNSIGYPNGNVRDVFTNASNRLGSKEHEKFNESDNSSKIPWNNTFQLTPGISPSKLEVLFNILALHKTLKRVRNNMNHAAADSPFEIPAIDLALKVYMSWMRVLDPQNIK